MAVFPTSYRAEQRFLLILLPPEFKRFWGGPYLGGCTNFSILGRTSLSLRNSSFHTGGHFFLGQRAWAPLWNYGAQRFSFARFPTGCFFRDSARSFFKTSLWDIFSGLEQRGLFFPAAFYRVVSISTCWGVIKGVTISKKGGVINTLGGFYSFLWQQEIFSRGGNKERSQGIMKSV